MAPRLVIPPGKTLFEEMKHTYDDIQVGPAPEHKIPTSQFLEATESFVMMFHVSEGMVFNMVEKDMVGNIAKLRERFLAAPLESETLQDTVNNELAAKQKKASDSLFWLTRGLEFTSQSIKHTVENADSELTNSFTTMYQTTLKPYHNWIMQKGFQAGLKTVPYKKDFLSKLGDDQEKVISQAKVWLAGIDRILGILNPFIDSKKKDLGIKA